MGEPKVELMIKQLGEEVDLMLELRAALIDAQVLMDKLEKMREKKFAEEPRRVTK